MNHTTSKKKFIILTTQRAGSVFLEKYLHSHRQIGCFGEVLLGMGGPQTPWIPEWLTRYRRPRLAWFYTLSGAMVSPKRTIKTVFGQDFERVGFRGMYNQLQDRRALAPLAADPSIAIIHLMRKNVLKQYVSRYIMRRHRHLGRLRAHTTKELKPVAVNIPPSLAEKGIRRLLSRRNQYKEAFKSHRTIELVYEEMIQNNQIMPQSVESICNILEVSNEFEEPQLKKMNPSTLSLMLTNFDQWQSYFKNTEFAEMLE